MDAGMLCNYVYRITVGSAPMLPGARATLG
jgi:hypothetical protein